MWLILGTLRVEDLGHLKRLLKKSNAVTNAFQREGQGPPPSVITLQNSQDQRKAGLDDIPENPLSSQILTYDSYRI